jgi:hypothetical protein
VHGTIGEPSHNVLDGTLTVSRLDDNFPPTQWPVCDSQFKALVYMQPGPNKIRFEFSSPKLANSTSSNPIHVSYLTIHMLPPTSSPPLQLAILIAKDSPESIDSIPVNGERDGNELQTAIQKFRMSAYLWQAFTAEQMWRQKLGRRSFRFEEEWIVGSSNQRDNEHGTMRSEARVHVIRCDKTIAEMRDLERTRQGGLFDLAAETLKNTFPSPPGQKQYFSILILDSHVNTATKSLTGHATASGMTGDLNLAIFGSHYIQSYPSNFEGVVPAFTNCTPTDLNLIANGQNETGSSWEAANMGIGGHLRAIGQMFGCHIQENGIMARDYVVLNRTFVAREAFSTRTKSKGGLVLQQDECSWHRLDCLRFRSHPCFKLPNDHLINPDESVQAYPVEGSSVVATAATGISYVEVRAEGDDVCHTWIEYPAENGTVQRQVALVEQDLRHRLPEDKQKGRIRLKITSHGGGMLEIDDFKKLCSKASSVKLENGATAFRSLKLGVSQPEESKPQEVLFKSASKAERVLSRIAFYQSDAVDGIEFVYDDDSTQLFGKKEKQENGLTFELGTAYVLNMS